jgi:DNA-binding MarR family transcriptional regulator
MTRGSLELLKLDRLIHDASRLLILTFLYPVARVDYLNLQKRLGLSQGNLSSHLAKLERAGYVAIEKGFKGKYPQTFCSMTKKGRETFELYAEMLKQVSGTVESAKD